MRHLNENQLTLVKNLKSIDKLLKKTQDRSLNVVAWKLIGNQKISTPISIRIIRRHRQEIVIENADINNLETFSNLISSSDIINIYIPNEIILFQVKIISRGYDKEVLLGYPKEVALVSKRKNIRLILTEKDLLEVDIIKLADRISNGHVILKKNFCDISSGGGSFYLNKTEATSFKIDNKSFDINFKINNYKISCEAQVRSIQVLGPEDDSNLIYKLYKIGVNFIYKNENDKRIIEEYIQSKSSGIINMAR